MSECQKCGAKYVYPVTICVRCVPIVEAEARGYARAVADISQLALNSANLHTSRMSKAKSAASKRAYANSAELLLNFCQAITDGAHVGAAKKEGT